MAVSRQRMHARSTQPPYSLKKLTMRGLTISMSAEAFRRAIPALMRTSGDELASFRQTLLAKLLQRLRGTAHLLCRKTAQTPGIGPIGNSATASIWPACWVSCDCSIRLVASLACSASVGTARRERARPDSAKIDRSDEIVIAHIVNERHLVDDI